MGASAAADRVQPPADLHAAASGAAAALRGAESRGVLVAGKEAIVAHRAELEELAARSGQANELVDIDYFFDRPARVHYVPMLFLLYDRHGRLLGAALLYDSWFLLGRGRLFMANNRRGLRTIFAPREERVGVAAAAAQALLERGALFVNIDFDLGPLEPDEALQAQAYQRAKAVAALHLLGLMHAQADWALHAGVKRFDMELQGDYDSTLKPLSQHTRRNLRYFHRRCVKDLGACFVNDVRMTLDEFLAFNGVVDYAAPEPVARWRFHSLTRYPDVFLVGMRAQDGTWLSLLAGRRRGGEVSIDWQMNRKGYEKYSLSSAMRSMLLTHEIALGSRSLSLEGGTSHIMGSNFRFRSVYNLAVRRRSVTVRVLSVLLARYAKEKLVTRALVKPWRVWIPCWRNRRPVA